MNEEISSGSKDPPEEARSTRWLAQGFEALVASLEGNPEREASGIDFDVVIVGTGYGGAVAAAELARTRGGRRVCVLERGNEHLPGSFPSRMSELPGHVRFSTKEARHARGRRDGLFDVRIGDDLCALVGNGLGGGSLINAGVMAMPDKAVFASTRWPAAFREAATVEALAEMGGALGQRLGATRTVASVDHPKPLKYQALGSFHGGARVEPLPITVALEENFHTFAGVRIDACVRCGDCATGCNHNAKVSLDATLLADARQHGAELFTGATVLRIEKKPGVWHLHVVHTDEPLRRRQGGATVIRARRVVLAAGTFGSTEILLRSQQNGLRLSHKLGHHVSANGDLIAAAYGGRHEANCAGDEDVDPTQVSAHRRVGPTITGMVDLRATDGMLIQDLAVPGPLRPLLEQSLTTSCAIHLLAESDPDPHGPHTRDACAVDAEAIRRTLMVAIIGHDSADGVMKLNAGEATDAGDGATTIRWPTLRDDPRLKARHHRLEELLRDSGARALPNPMWQLMPEKLQDLLGGDTGPLLTVHPLGGCPMGDDATCGVVDDCGRVFDAGADEKDARHEGLVVLDGSIIPASLGINPALTIATVALRAVGLLRGEWGYTAEASARADIGNRPRFRTPGPVEPSRDTRIEVLERLSGPVPLRGIGGSGPLAAHVELTLRFDPIAIRDLTSGTRAATLRLQAAHGRLRLFARRPADDTEAPDQDAMLIATVTGTLRAFSHKRSSSAGRRWQGLWAWFRNRGLRDTVLWVIDRWKGQGPAPVDDKTFVQEAVERGKSLWALSSRAGGARLFEYELLVENVLASSLPADVQQSFAGAAIRGEKELTYSRRANPWRQLSQVKLMAFPRARTSGAVLELDTGYLARQKVPLFRIVEQQDHAKALVDVASLGLYLTRMLIHLHAWSFRLPDEPPPRDIQRLPGYVPGLPVPRIHEFPVAGPHKGQPVMVRLTHYPFSRSKRAQARRANPAAEEAIRAPILLIHGYSASGTTFAHHSVRPNVASSLWDRGRDVWIADLRTSAGMPHARVPWTFEQVGMADIPVAVHQVCALTGAAKIDVFAHCMGSAMLGMALLGSESERERFLPLRRELPDRIRRLVMSQVAPAVVFTPDNTFRAYAMQYLRHFLPLDDYEFRPTGPRSHKDRLMDRLLATLPYPQEEFDRENPFWPPWRRTPWVGTRHRMDALYGRDFNVNNLTPRMLDCIDDHFGPLNIETVSQAVHFARLRAITTRKGFNDFVRPDRLREKLRFPILHVHGRRNGLVSNRTPAHFRKVLTDSDARFENDHAFQRRLYDDAGHQDLLIGRPAAAMFEHMNRYLEAPLAPVAQAPTGIRIVFSARIPAHGVRLPPPFDGHDRCSLGDEGANGAPVAALLIPVVRRGGRCLPVDDDGLAMEPTVQALAERVHWRALKPVSANELATRYTFELNGFAPPQGGAGLLVLVLYNQSAALQPGAGSPISELAAHVASRSPGGKGFASLAGMAADPDSAALAGADGAKDLTDRIVQAMAQAVRRTFERVSSVELGLGTLHPPARPDPSPFATRSFALASCQYPGDILDRTPPGTPEESPAGPCDASYLRLLALLEGRRGAGESGEPPLPKPQFLVLTGDQIYADATAGLFDPRRLDDRFRISYEAFFGARGPRSVLSRLPAVMQPDDHEIADNWEPGPPDGDDAEKSGRLRRIGIREYLRNQRDEDFEGPTPPKLWHATPVHGLPFFWADARTRREPRTAATVGGASMLDPEQEQALDDWLADTSTPGPRFFVSAPMVLPRHLQTRGADTASAIRSDAWDGFPASLHRLLAKVHARGRDDVIFLSGDAHVSNVCRIEVGKTGEPGVVVAHSVHSSALYAPYPFANGIEQDFAGRETFEFQFEGADYECTVETRFPLPGDGFAVVSVSQAQADAGWRLNVRFDRESRSPHEARNSFDIHCRAPSEPDLNRARAASCFTPASSVA
jgi:choline dehydrogenase-like flavoprotein